MPHTYRKMSIEITIRNKSGNVKQHVLKNNTPNILTIIDDIQAYTDHGSELVVFLFDPDSTSFHKYTFDYLKNSPMYPRHWLLNNILYSIMCKDSNNFAKLVIPVHNTLKAEYDRIRPTTD